MEESNESAPRKDWLDRVAPVRKGSYREAAGGLFLFAVLSLGGSAFMFTRPFWEFGTRLPLPNGVFGILAIFTGTWFALCGVNLLRRTKKYDA